MKGLVILLVLFGVIGSALYLLVRPSDVDLRRIEDEIAATLDSADADLAEATRRVNTLRAIKPNILALDHDLNALRESARIQRERMGRLRAEDPDPVLHRSVYLDPRRQARAEAEQLVARVADLNARAELLNAYMQETQPRLRVLQTAFLELERLAGAAQAAGREIDEEVAIKIDYLRTDVERKQALAKSVFETSAQDVQQGRILNATVRKEIDLVITEIEALARRLQDARQPASAGG